MANNIIKDIASDMIQDAVDWIGNDLEKFNADNQAMDTMRNNEKFREYVERYIRDSDVEEYRSAMVNQYDAACYIWRLYVHYAYGNAA